MQKNKWEYKGVYKNVNMDGLIELPNDSKLRVNDLTVNMPSFMKEADVLFIDPPCSKGNLKSFYTKSEKDLNIDFDFFEKSLFDSIDKIKPNHLFLELFKSNKDRFIEKASLLFSNMKIYDSFYYNNRKNKCWVVHFTNDKIQDLPINDMDEEKIIKWICENFEYKCIGDLCMGKGLVGRYAYRNGKKFVGTELNKKRLGVLVDHIKNGTKWNQR